MGENKRIAINSIIIFVRLCAISLIGIIASRIVLDQLGASDYGLYNVVGGIVTLLNVVATSMTSTTYRYIAYELGKGVDGNTNKVFNASFFIHSCFALLIIILGFTIGDWYLNNYVNLPEGRLEDAHFVFHWSVFTAAATTLIVPYRGLLVAFENFKVSAVVDVMGRLVYILLIIFLLKSGENKIRVYAVIHFVIVLVEAVPYILFSRSRHFSTVKFSIVRDWAVYKGMLSFSVWTLYGAVSTVGTAQGRVLLINYFFGTLVNAAFAVGQQVNGFIKSFALSLNNAAVPQITKNFSGGNVGRSISLASYISKYTFILMAFVAFPVMLDMDFLLGLWLKEVPKDSALFCSWLVLINLVQCLGEGIPPIVQASGKLAPFQLIICTFNLLGLPFTWLAFHFGAPPVATLVIFLVLNLSIVFIRLWLVYIILKLNVRPILVSSYLRVFLISIPCVLLFFIYKPSNFTVAQHIMGFVFIELFLLIDIALLGLDKQERSLVINFIQNRRKRHMNNE